MGNTKKQSKAKRLVWIGAVASIAGLIWILWYYLPAKTGDLYFEAGDYLRAANAYQSNPFLMERYQEAILRQGDVYFEEGDYLRAAKTYKSSSRLIDRYQEAMLRQAYVYLEEKNYPEAIDCYSQTGERDLANWANAVANYAAQVWQEGEQKLALKILEDVPQVENRQQIIDGAMLETAQAFAQNDQDYEKALEIAGMISDQTRAVKLYDTIYAGLAETKLELLISGKAEGDLLTEAIALLDQCSQDAGYGKSVEGLRLLSEGSVDKATDIFLTEKSAWLRKLLPELVHQVVPDDSTPEKVLTWCYSAAALREECSPDIPKTKLRSALGTRGFAFRDDKAFFAFPKAMDEMRKNWKGKEGRDGKILILREDAYSRGKYYVDTKLMGLLPLDYIPESPERVEYVVVVSYGAERKGSYSSGIPALREFGRVYTYRLPNVVEISRSAVCYGDDPPLFIQYIGSGPSYGSGGAPDLVQEVYEALMALIGTA